MVPLLTIDEEFVNKNWKKVEDREWVKNHCKVFSANNSNIPFYQCDDSWVNLGVFKEFKSVVRFCDFSDYGYCDTEEALIKYLQKYVDDKDNDFFIEFGFLSIHYEKYYKFGSYINKDGINTEDDYYNYIDKYPEMKVDQDVKDKWIRFCVYKLKKRVS